MLTLPLSRLRAALALGAALAPAATLPGWSTPLAAQEADGGGAEAADTTAVLYGTVREAGTGRPLGDAEVRIVGLGRSTLTDSTGAYRLRGLEPGEDSVTVEYLSGRARTEYVWLGAGMVTRLDVELRPEAVEVAELQVEVEGNRDRRMREILALEVYHGGEAPARFKSMRGCGAVAIWLRHGAD